MAIEKNPFDKIEETLSNVVQLPEQIKEATGAPIIEPDEDGGVTVDFTQATIEMEPESETQEWYGNIANNVEEGELAQIAEDVVNNYTAYKIVTGKRLQ